MKNKKVKGKKLLTIHRSPFTTKGFTLVEILVSLAVGAIILAVAGINLASFRNQHNLTSEAESLVALLTSAREKSLGQELETRWGVFVVNNASDRDTYALIEINETLLASSSYSGAPGTISDLRTAASNVEFASPASGSSTTIVFNKVSGLPQASTTLILQNVGNADLSKTIFISGNGRLSYE